MPASFDFAKLGQAVPDERWRAHVVLLETDKSPLSAEASSWLMKNATDEPTPREKGQFRMLTRAALETRVKRYGLADKAEALGQIMREDRIAGLKGKGVRVEEEEEEEEGGTDEGAAQAAGADEGEGEACGGVT